MGARAKRTPGSGSTPSRPRSARRAYRSKGQRRVVKIVELTAYHVRIPLRTAIRHASHRRTDTDNVLVRCVLEDRTEGHGEGVPREYVTGETVDSALDLLRQ